MYLRDIKDKVLSFALRSSPFLKKSNTVREQPPRLCKNNNAKINCESAIGQHLITNPECAKTYTDDNFRIIGQARSSFHLSVFKSVYIKSQNPVLYRQKISYFHWGYSSKQWRIVPNWPLLESITRIPSRVTASGYIFRSTFQSLSDVLCSDECWTRKAFQYVKRMLPLFRAVVKFHTTNRLFKN